MMVETSFKTPESEIAGRSMLQNRSEAEWAITCHIDGIYNPVRGHSALDFVIPVRKAGRPLT